MVNQPTSISEKLLEAVVDGTASATTWAVLVWLYNFAKNAIQECKIRKSFDQVGIGSGTDGFSVILHNRTNKEVRIREVGLYTKDGLDLILGKYILGSPKA